MISQLPSPGEIAGHYDRLMRDLQGDYIQNRWGDSEIKRRHYRQTELALREALRRIGAPGDVLEIGCGPAVWTPLFLEQADRVLLSDISEEMLAGARERIGRLQGGRFAAKVAYQCGDFLTTPLDRRFDTILSARAFEYMSDKRGFADKSFELLRPGGSLVLVTKNKNWRDLRRTARSLKDVPREHISVAMAMQLDLMDWKEVREMLRTVGFGEVSIYPVVFGSFLRPLTWPGGLSLGDALHRRYYRRPLRSGFDSLVESYLVVGRKPVQE
jgi:SAM-dependent methyltransferase